ncbi:hypothetical protein LNKW23_46180 [Paralimibaculum aggregatum]|uniref:Uncharacterized protein n=1 Tax=Paralimibaculum aggregatum TaxID=3036245 RepID=A0ABQ6LTI5_9RHOB|nr:DUF2793 domain-containing protein [Limibaculum sp. NKW23]GMG85398.1 hypothetical protein LNKW23_46180 [Limibaculum sp. NKW23]
MAAAGPRPSRPAAAEARSLDGVVHLAVLDRDLTAPPASPADGGRHIVVSGATGDWADWDLDVAPWTGGACLTMTSLAIGDTVEPQGLLRAADGHFAADHTMFWGAKIG